MGSVISSILSAITNIWNAINAIPKAINSVISWVQGWINSLDKDLTNVYNTLSAYIQSVENYDIYLFGFWTTWAANQLQSLQKAFSTGIAIVLNFAEQVYADVMAVLGAAIADALSRISAIWDYINKTIIGDWIAKLIQALDWILTVGEFMYNLLTHPDKLLALIGDYLLTAWLALVKKYATPFFKWFYASAISLAPDFSGILEDVISSLFD